MCDVDSQLKAQVDHIENTKDIGSHRFNLVVLTPVGVGIASVVRALCKGTTSDGTVGCSSSTSGTGDGGGDEGDGRLMAKRARRARHY